MLLTIADAPEGLYKASSDEILKICNIAKAKKPSKAEVVGVLPMTLVKIAKAVKKIPISHCNKSEIIKPL